jgi:hypothetical protein
MHKQVFSKFNSIAENKLVHDIIQRYRHWPGTYPILPTNQKEEYTAKSNLQPYPQMSHLKTQPWVY